MSNGWEAVRGGPGAKKRFRMFHFVSFPIWAPWILGAVWGADEIGIEGVWGEFGRYCYRGPGAAGCGAAGRRLVHKSDHGGMIAQKFFEGKDCLNCDFGIRGLVGWEEVMAVRDPDGG